jgi:hypothetical protein
VIERRAFGIDYIHKRKWNPEWSQWMSDPQLWHERSQSSQKTLGELRVNFSHTLEFIDHIQRNSHYNYVFNSETNWILLNKSPSAGIFLRSPAQTRDNPSPCLIFPGFVIEIVITGCPLLTRTLVMERNMILHNNAWKYLRALSFRYVITELKHIWRESEAGFFVSIW